jgi:hypothetical protein
MDLHVLIDLLSALAIWLPIGAIALVGFLRFIWR